MFTVLFVNDNTSKFLEDYRFLFRPFELRGEIAFCNWNEEGDTEDTAVPQLCAILSGHHEWRALILNTDAVTNYDGCPFPTRQNPFDYSEADPDTSPHESPIPIVRLSQILAGYSCEPRREFEDGYLIHYHNREVRIPVSELDSLFVGDGGNAEADESDFDLEAFVQKRAEFSAESLRENDRFLQLCSRYRLDPEWLEEIRFEDFRPVYLEKKPSAAAIERCRILNAKYRIVEARPAEIHLIALRVPSNEEERRRIEEVWKAPLEMSSSSFWERNQYPTTVRFLFSEIELHDVSAYERGKSIFWYAVMTFALNRIPSASLQAYRLYRLSVDINRDTIQRLLNEHIDRLQAVKGGIQEQLSKEPELTHRKNETLVPIQHIPVVIESDDGHDMFDRTTDEIEGLKGVSDILSQRIEDKKKNANEYGRNPRRAIDRAARFVREKAARFEGETFELDEVQRENLCEYIRRLEAEVLTTRPRNRYDKQKVIDTTTKVRQDVNMKTSTAMDDSVKYKAFLAAGVTVVFGFSPYLWYIAREGNEALLLAIVITAVTVALTLAGGALAIYWSNEREKQTIDQVTAPLEGLKRDVINTRDEYDKYFTDICTLMKAYSILNGTNIREDESVIARRRLFNHLKAIEVSVRRNMRWLGAFEMERLATGMSRSALEFEPETVPEENALYYLSAAPEDADIPLNNTGDWVRQPYSFVERLVIEREEIFEDISTEQ